MDTRTVMLILGLAVNFAGVVIIGIGSNIRNMELRFIGILVFCFSLFFFLGAFRIGKRD